MLSTNFTIINHAGLFANRLPPDAMVHHNFPAFDGHLVLKKNTHYSSGIHTPKVCFANPDKWCYDSIEALHFVQLFNPSQPSIWGSRFLEGRLS